MMPWFVWNNRNSYAEGLWINKLPKITRANERYTEITVPGRAGNLIMLEGDDVYESYTKEITVITRNENPRLQEILNWLRGEGELIICTENDKIYDARIAAEVAFERISNDLCQAKIPFYCKPFKRMRNEETILVDANGETTQAIYNPGDVASKPVVEITSGTACAVTIAGNTMSFTSNPNGTIVVDCDAHIITKNGSLWTGNYSGEFWKIPTGASTVVTSKDLSIRPRWRWV